MIRNIEPFPPPLDMVQCDKCGWKGKCEDAHQDWEQPSVDGMASGEAYQVHYCPNCANDDILEDYFYSEELGKKVSEEYYKREAASFGTESESSG